MIIVNNIADFLLLKPKGSFRIDKDNGGYLIAVCPPDEPEEYYTCATPGLANQLRMHFTEAGMTGYVEGGL